MPRIQPREARHFVRLVSPLHFVPFLPQVLWETRGVEHVLAVFSDLNPRDIALVFWGEPGHRFLHQTSED